MALQVCGLDRLPQRQPGKSLTVGMIRPFRCHPNNQPFDTFEPPTGLGLAPLPVVLARHRDIRVQIGGSIDHGRLL